MRLRNLLSLIFICNTLSFFGQNISSIKFEGLTRTKESYLRSLIVCQEGVKFEKEILNEDVQIIKNLNLFFDVKSRYHLDSIHNTYQIVIIVKESTYIFPILIASGFQDVIKLQAGATDINFQGKQQTLGGLYQYYDRHSLSLFYNVPRHKNNKTGHSITLSKYSTIEPLYFSQTTANFNYDNYSVYISGRYWINRYMNIDLGTSPFYEKYKKINEDLFTDGVPSGEIDFYKLQVNSNFNFNNIDYRYELLNGIKYNFYVETIHTKDKKNSEFYLARSEFIYHKKIRSKSNFSFRHQFGISTNKASPFSAFVLDGFLNIRGIGNRIARGSGIHFVNLEYKYTPYQNKLFILQLVGFTDIGNIRNAGDELEELFNLESTKIYSGLGLRLHLNKIYKSIFRLDYGIKLADKFEGGFSFGIGQFF